MQLDEPRAYHGALRDVAVRQVSQLAGKEAHEGLAIGGFLDAQDDFFKGNVGLRVPVSTASQSHVSRATNIVVQSSVTVRGWRTGWLRARIS